MTRLLIAPNAFKGSLSPVEAAQALKAGFVQGARNLDLDLSLTILPLPDGGDGTVEALGLSIGGRLEHLTVHGALGAPSQATTLVTDEFAVVELASACGIAKLNGALEPIKANTFGLGEAIVQTFLQGSKSIFISLGGSASTDGGIGALMALGARFYTAGGKLIESPWNDNLDDIESVDLSAAVHALEGAKLVVLTDVDNPLLGECGAARVFAGQKGASEKQIAQLERRLSKLVTVMAAASKSADCENLPGSGAAGGTAFGLGAALGAEIKSGFNFIAEHCRLHEHISQADIVVTGEGRFDAQSLSGKSTGRLFDQCRKLKKRLWIIAGESAMGDVLGVEKIISLKDELGRNATTADLSDCASRLAAQVCARKP